MTDNQAFVVLCWFAGLGLWFGVLGFCDLVLELLFRFRVRRQVGRAFGGRN